jgi:hypothetical protein
VPLQSPLDGHSFIFLTPFSEGRRVALNEVGCQNKYVDMLFIFSNLIKSVIGTHSEESIDFYPIIKQAVSRPDPKKWIIKGK